MIIIIIIIIVIIILAGAGDTVVRFDPALTVPLDAHLKPLDVDAAGQELGQEGAVPPQVVVNGTMAEDINGIHAPNA